jgi:hypothetical protein
VTDRSEWDRVFPAYVPALGLVGRMTLGDLDAADDDRLESLRATLPFVRIRPTGLAGGPADPGGGLWIVAQAFGVIGMIRLATWAGRVARRSWRS